VGPMTEIALTMVLLGHRGRRKVAMGRDLLTTALVGGMIVLMTLGHRIGEWSPFKLLIAYTFQF